MRISFEGFKNTVTIMFLISLMVFPRSHLILKLSCIAIFLASNILYVLLANKGVKTYSSINYFYSLVSIAGIGWSLIGLYNGGAVDGIFDNIRLYVIWSMAYLVILTLIRNNSEINVFHSAIVTSGILIATINFLGLANHYFKLGLIPFETLKKLEMSIGIHAGYIQIFSHNIGTLFFIVPYLIVMTFYRRDKNRPRLFWTNISLLLSLVLAVVSGRRALWICIAITPIIIISLSLIINYHRNSRKKVRTWVKVYFIAVIIFSILQVLPKHENSSAGFIQHISAAFSEEDERSIQLSYLLNSFLERPYLGSGFGVNAGYTRNLERPWIYELTYFQILFNFGIIGVFYLVLVLVFYLCRVILTVRNCSSESFIPFGLFVGLLSFLIGAYSNPYLGSFDFLLYLGMFPYLGSYKSKIIKTGTLRV